MQACEAWKKEAEDSSRKMKVAEEDKQTMTKQRDEVYTCITALPIFTEKIWLDSSCDSFAYCAFDIFQKVVFFFAWRFAQKKIFANFCHD